MVNLATGKGCHRDRSDEAELVVVVAHGAETAARSWWPAKPCMNDMHIVLSRRGIGLFKLFCFYFNFCLFNNLVQL